MAEKTEVSEKAPIEQVDTINSTAIDQVEEGDSNKKVKYVQGSERWAQATAVAPPSPWTRNNIFIYLMCIAPFLCGTMSGYDSSIMGSFLVEASFQKVFGAGVNGFAAGYITAIYQIAGIVAIPFISFFIDRFGRRSGVFWGSLISVAGAIIQATSDRTGSLGQFLTGRFLLGFGAVIAQAAATTYTVEISHPAYRGALAGGQSSMLNFGGLLAAAVSYATVNMAGNANWTIPTWVQIACPGIACVTVYFLPESPRWLYTHGKRDQAMEFMTKYHGEGDAENPWVRLQLVEFEEQLEIQSKEAWWDYRALFTTRARRWRLANSLMIGVWGALSNGGISYFIGAFFDSAGITDPNTVLRLNVYQNFMSTMASFIGSPLSDSLGRRKLLLPTLFTMGLAWAGMAAGTAVVEADPSNKAAANAGIAFYFIFAFIYCIGITPLQGVYATEVFAYEQRAKGVAFQNLGVNAAGLINQFATPVALQKIGYRTYIIFAVWNIVQWAISYFYSVETKGYTLEELEEIFDSPNPRKASTQKRRVVTMEE